MNHHRDRRVGRGLAALPIALALLAGCGDDADAPAADDDRYMPLVSTQEAGELMYACMTDLGWDVALNGFGELEATYPEDQDEPYTADLETCHAEHGLDKPPPPMSRETAEEFYDLVVASAACIEGLGIEVSEPPSREAYVEALTASQVLLWDPHGEALDAVADWDALRTECPQPERPDLDG